MPGTNYSSSLQFNRYNFFCPFYRLKKLASLTAQKIAENYIGNVGTD